MREIKFRQWDSIKSRYYHNIGVSGPGEFSGPPMVTWAKYPLEQFTGLKDKKGVEIYEGDILGSHIDQGKSSVQFMVVFENGCFGRRWTHPSENHPSDHVFTPFFADGEVEDFHNFIVIGNIHENPGLLTDA